ncbi:MAG TPA: hypothetical protein VJI32_00190 [Candidatus Nanoarchaeia archaeon]|nr:hypothetical protein [Candidatus Nanoarchaeia archaeon]
MDYTNLSHVCQRAADFSIVVGGGVGFAGMALYAATDEDLISYRNGVVIYDAVLAGILGGIGGGLMGGVVKSGLEYLVQRL